MTTTTTSLRSTLAITSFVELSDELAAIQIRAKQITAELKRLTPEVLEQIGDRREVRVNKQVRVLTPRIDESIGRACTDEEIVEFCRQNELKFQTRSPEYVAPATFTKYVKEGLIPEPMIERTITTGVSVI